MATLSARNEKNTSGRIDLLIVSFYFPPNLGGIETFLERLAAAASDDVNLAVLAPSLPGAADCDAALPFAVTRRPMLAATIFRHKKLYKPLYPLLLAVVQFWTLIECLRRRPRFIAVGSADFALAAVPAAFLFRIPFGFLCHGKDVHVKPGLISRLFKRLPLLFALGRASRIWVNSEYTRSLLNAPQRWSAKVTGLKVPITLTGESKAGALAEARRIIFGSDESDAADDPTRGPVLLSVGRFVERKGYADVIRALPGLAEEFPSVVYVIVGSGEDEPNLRRLAVQMSVQDRIIFAGEHKPPDAFYALADVFVTVSVPVRGEVEGFGMVFLEAGCFGVPSVAGRHGGMPEAVRDGETGLLVEPGDSAAIGEAIADLLRDAPKREAMGERARQFAREFDPGRTAEKFLRDCGLAATSEPEKPDRDLP